METGWRILKGCIYNGRNKYIPISNFKAWRHKTEWKYPIDKETKNLIKHKHRLWTRYIETRDPEVEQKYRTIRNAVKQRSIIKARGEQEAVAKECKLNLKKFWAFVKSKSKTSNTMGEIIITEANGNKLLITDDEQKSNAFVEYFSSVFSHEPDTLFEEIPKVNLAYDMSNRNEASRRKMTS